MTRFLVFMCVLYTIVLECTNGAKLLLISMDGFRWDYVDKVPTPNFDAFGAQGVHPQYINNTFITKTFPCHYSIATGLYEETHGIIANHMFDPVLNESFNMGTKTTHWWNGGEPLWVTARKAGLKSAVYYWPGSEAEIRGYRPNEYKAYNESVSFETRVDTVVEWLSGDIDLAMLYFHEPDATGHKYGPDSDEVKDVTKRMDTLLGYIVHKLKDTSIWSDVNVMVTSDHGMANIDIPNKHIDLLDYVDSSALARVPSLGPVANIQVSSANLIEDVVRNLSNVDHLEVYRRQDMPDYWHYSNNKRILDIVAVAKEGWMIVQNISASKDLQEKGTHGFDNRLSAMKPIFYARGPNIRPSDKTLPFNSVDIYPLVCEILGISPAPNNGSLANTKAFLIPITNAAEPISFQSLNMFLTFLTLICLSA